MSVHAVLRRTSFSLVSVALFLGVISLRPTTVQAHHGEHELSVASAKCGWMAGHNLRDRSNLSDFCARWVPAHFRIKAATAAGERLWVEASPELASALLSDKESTAALLRDWLARWRGISGYHTASVTLLRRHALLAQVQTTMTGDAVRIVR